MAFFGLTALGAQNEFTALAAYSTFLNVFEEKDYEVVWRRVVGGEKHSLTFKVKNMVEFLYKGPPPPNDMRKIDDKFADCDHSETGTVSYYTFLSKMIELREEADAEDSEIHKGGQLKVSCEFNSSEDLHRTMRRNGKMEKTLQDKQISPLTQAQEFGWQKPEKLVQPTTGRKKTEITKYAAELLKNGIY